MYVNVLFMKYRTGILSNQSIAEILILKNSHDPTDQWEFTFEI